MAKQNKGILEALSWVQMDNPCDEQLEAKIDALSGVFEDLTEGVVLGWVWGKISKPGMEALAAKIKQEAENPAPVAVEVKLPWGKE